MELKQLFHMLQAASSGSDSSQSGQAKAVNPTGTFATLLSGASAEGEPKGDVPSDLKQVIRALQQDGKLDDGLADKLQHSIQGLEKRVGDKPTSGGENEQPRLVLQEDGSVRLEIQKDEPASRHGSRDGSSVPVADDRVRIVRPGFPQDTPTKGDHRVRVDSSEAAERSAEEILDEGEDHSIDRPQPISAGERASEEQPKVGDHRVRVHRRLVSGADLRDGITSPDVRLVLPGSPDGAPVPVTREGGTSAPGDTIRLPADLAPILTNPGQAPGSEDGEGKNGTGTQIRFTNAPKQPILYVGGEGSDAGEQTISDEKLAKLRAAAASGKKIQQPGQTPASENTSQANTAASDAPSLSPDAKAKLQSILNAALAQDGNKVDGERQAPRILDAVQAASADKGSDTNDAAHSSDKPRTGDHRVRQPSTGHINHEAEQVRPAPGFTSGSASSAQAAEQAANAQQEASAQRTSQEQSGARARPEAATVRMDAEGAPVQRAPAITSANVESLAPASPGSESEGDQQQRDGDSRQRQRDAQALRQAIVHARQEGAGQGSAPGNAAEQVPPSSTPEFKASVSEALNALKAEGSLEGTSDADVDIERSTLRQAFESIFGEMRTGRNSSATPVNRASPAAQANFSAWMRSIMNQPGRALSLNNGWQVLQVQLDEGQGSVTVSARRDDESVSVNVGFTDPGLRGQAAAHASRIHEALQAQYDQHVEFTLQQENDEQSPQQRRTMGAGGPELPGSSPDEAATTDDDGHRRASLRAALLGANHEWIA